MANAQMSQELPAPAGSRGVRETLRDLAMRYPPRLIEGQLADLDRMAFNITLVTDRVKGDVRICDLGGGIGLFSLGCAALGMKSVLVDDFSDGVNTEYGSLPETLHRGYGVQIVSADVVDSPPDFDAGSLDVVTSFDSMEHWHNSPKRLFKSILSWLKPGGHFILGVPNCANLRKRLTLPLGCGKWSSMAEWYEAERFRGHVREPDTDDLHYIARDMGLREIEIIGRNWLGYRSRYALVRYLTPVFDLPLRAMPSLCADIYLVGRKPERSGA